MRGHITPNWFAHGHGAALGENSGGVDKAQCSAPDNAPGPQEPQKQRLRRPPSRVGDVGWSVGLTEKQVAPALPTHTHTGHVSCFVLPALRPLHRRSSPSTRATRASSSSRSPRCAPHPPPRAPPCAPHAAGDALRVDHRRAKSSLLEAAPVEAAPVGMPVMPRMGHAVDGSCRGPACRGWCRTNLRRPFPFPAGRRSRSNCAASTRSCPARRTSGAPPARSHRPPHEATAPRTKPPPPARSPARSTVRARLMDPPGGAGGEATVGESVGATVGFPIRARVPS
jgi:hypothetical protein